MKSIAKISLIHWIAVWLAIALTSAVSQTIYIGPTSGAWENAANWSAGVPAAGDNVVIDERAQDSVVTTGSNAVFDLAINAGDQLVISNNNTFSVHGASLDIDGVLEIRTFNRTTTLQILGETNLTGSGSIYVLGVLRGTGSLINSATIAGTGSVGANELSVTNTSSGLIEANISGQNLVIDPPDDGALTNEGTLQASNNGRLRLGAGTFDNVGGLIQANGAEVQLLNGARITGGVLQTDALGLIRAVDFANALLADLTIAEGARVLGDNASHLRVLGAIANEGRISIIGFNRDTFLELQGDTVFEGNGEIVLGNLAKVNGAGALTNTGAHTIRGFGNLGLDAISIFNGLNASIVADVAARVLIVNPRAGEGTASNRGALGAEGGGILRLSGLAGGTFDNEGGVVRADGAGSEVQLTDNVELFGGSLVSADSGVIRIPDHQAASLSDITITGVTVIGNNDRLSLKGEFNHSGRMSIRAFNLSTGIVIDDFLDLKGGGSIELVNSLSNIRGNGVLINHDHEIFGAGNVGLDQAAITNTAGGTIHANVDGTLRLDPKAFLALTNDGVMRASNGGALLLDGSGGSEFANGATGVIEALDGGTVTHTNNPTLTNLKNGILKGGAYRAIDGGNGATLNLPGGNITTNAAHIELSGSGARFAQLSPLTENAGTLSLVNGATLNTSGDFTQAAGGKLVIGISGKPAETGLWGKLVEAGAATLRGALDVLFNIGATFAAVVGDTWKFLTAATITGQFDTVNFTAEGLPANSQLAVNYLADGVELAVVGTAPLKAGPITFNMWAVETGIAETGIAADEDGDPDLDGVTNLQEYAFAMDPAIPDAHLLPQIEPVVHGGEHYLGISFFRPAGPASPSDIEYAVEHSTDLENWTREDIILNTEPSDVVDVEKVSARCLTPMKGMAFLRVGITVIP